jgi:hypothetical protein
LCGYYMAAGYAALGMLDEAFAWLRKSCKEREAWTLFLPVDPQFYCLQSDGRLSALLQQLPTGTGGRTSSV